ncbi:unnamed protein product, partial [Brassica oleracea]
MVNRPAKIIQMVDRQVRNRLSSVRGVSEAIWHKVVAPLSKCEKNRVIIRNELGPGRSLEYHCHSNGKDQGVQFLKFNEERNFEFVDHFFGKKNKVNCVLRQGLWMQSSSRDFEAYHTSNNKQTWIYLWNYVLSKHTGIIIFGVVKNRLLQMFVPSEEFEKNGGIRSAEFSFKLSRLSNLC